MAKKLRIVLAQINLTVGDIAGNLQKHITAAIKARDEFHADIIVFPELGITGYPPEDLLLRKHFITAAHDALQVFINEVKGIHCLVCHPHMTSHGLHNSCSMIYNGTILSRYAKQYLPNYGVFDERRYFIPDRTPSVVTINGVNVAMMICEDIWYQQPAQVAAAHGARIILCPNASPFDTHKHEERLAVLAKQAKINQLPIVYVNTVGAQDEIIFDGGSMVINEEGKLAQFAGFFNETLFPVDIEVFASHTTVASTEITYPSTLELIYQALVLGVRDYIHKNNFKSVIIGVSGGIDSALTLAIAVDALGKQNVHAVTMPSRYTADISTEDAIEIANNFQVSIETISIEPTYKSFLTSLKNSFADKNSDITEENIQARCRAVILMALSNKFGHLVLTTGNRSEIAVGYCTLYGDMAGAFAVLKDVPKTLVYELARYRNNISPVIPERTIERAPTAELAENQKDADSLPPYSELDQILFSYLNLGLGIDEIVAAGFNRDVVTKIVNLIRKSEYKRRQSAIGPRINHKSFGRDWRYPVTNGFKG